MTHHSSETDHGHSCGCSHGCGGGGCCQSRPTFSQEERTFLLTLLERQFLPMVQFIVKSSTTHAFEMVALSPVYLENITDTMEQVCATRDMLYRLEDMGLLTLDFEIPLDALSYEVYEQSAVFSYFQETVALSQRDAHRLGDIATMEQGTIAITEACIKQFSA